MKNYVKEKRRSLDLTQNQLAVRAGVTQATVSRIENGVPPSLWTALLIARALDTPVEVLFALEKYELPEAQQHSERGDDLFNFHQQLLYLMQLLLSLDERQLHKVIILVEHMAK